MTLLRLALASLPPLGLLLASYAGCSGKSDGDADGSLDAAVEDAPDAEPEAAGDAGGESDAEPPWGTLGPWDPIWHETAPFAWPEVSHDGLPSCGSGCTMLTAYKPHPFIPFSVDGSRVAYNTVHMNGTDTFALFVDLKTLKEYLIDDGKSEPRLPTESECEAAAPALAGDYVEYIVTCPSHSRLVLRSLVTGEKKTVAIFGPISEGTPCKTGLTPSHAYWAYCPQAGWNSVSSFDLKTGETKTTTAGVSTCRTFWVRPGPKGDVVLCTNEDVERIVLVDIANDQASLLSPSDYSQNHGYLSPDGAEVVWLDYRDPGPNGEHGSYDYQFAGEIYWKSLVTGEQKRLTFDNPSDPVKKQWPSIRDGIIAWEDWRTLPNKNPGPSGQGYYLLAAPVRYQKGLDGGAQDLGTPQVYWPQATSDGVVVKGGIVLPDGGNREALFRYAWP